MINRSSMRGQRWEYIDDFPDYMISSEGEVYNAKTRLIRKLTMNQYGVVMVQLTRDTGVATRGVALLVARAFIPNDDPRFNTPIHLDGDKENCRVENLAWRPRAFALAYHRQFGQPDFHHPGAPVMVVETGECFDDTRDAALKYGLIRNHIVLAIAHHTTVFPTGHTFIIINKHQKLAI